MNKELTDKLTKLVNYWDKPAAAVADLLLPEIERLNAIIEEPNWVDFIKVTRSWLTKYPPDIFTGISGDPGPVFVVAIRGALAELDCTQTTEQRENDD